MLRAWAEQRATAAKGEGRTLETDGTIVGEERVYKKAGNRCLQFGELLAWHGTLPVTDVPLHQQHNSSSGSGSSSRTVQTVICEDEIVISDRARPGSIANRCPGVRWFARADFQVQAPVISWWPGHVISSARHHVGPNCARPAAARHANVPAGQS